MATVQSANYSPARILVRNAPPAEPSHDVLLASPSLAQILGHVGQILLGLMLLLLGSAMVLTLWLMPIGLPLALLGVALIVAGNSS